MQHITKWLLGQMAGNIKRKVDKAVTCKDKTMIAIEVEN